MSMYYYFKHNLALLKELQKKSLNEGQVSLAEELQVSIDSFTRLTRMH